jgi:hypothetical protein
LLFAAAIISSKVHNLGSLHQDQDKLAEAEQMYVRALAGTKRCWDRITRRPSPPSTISGLYRDQGKLAEAEQMLVRALTGREKALGPDHKSSLGTVPTISGTCTRNKADVGAGRLAGNEKALGPDHTVTARTPIIFAFITLRVFRYQTYALPP